MYLCTIHMNNKHKVGPFTPLIIINLPNEWDFFI